MRTLSEKGYQLTQTPEVILSLGLLGVELMLDEVAVVTWVADDGCDDKWNISLGHSRASEFDTSRNSALISIVMLF